MNTRTMLLLQSTVAVVLAFGPIVVGQRAQLFPVPIYPPDGQIPAVHDKQYVFLDAATRDLVVSYPSSLEGGSAGEPESRKLLKIELATHVAPDVAVSVSRSSAGGYIYRYLIRNRQVARQEITRWYLSIPKPNAPNYPAKASELPFPRDLSGQWDFRHFGHAPGQWAARWERKPGTGPLRPGGESLEFGVESDLKPGFTTAFFQGPSADLAVPPGLPKEVLEQLSRFQQLRYNSHPLLTIGPMFRSQTPPVAIAGELHVGVSRFVRSGRLNGASPYIMELLSALQQYIDQAVSRAEKLEEGQPLEPVPMPSLRSKPSSPEETEINNMFRLALDWEG
ncbi:MAG: hypothetical protein ACE15E_23935 [Acidobacteriota bacterium]